MLSLFKFLNGKIISEDRKKYFQTETKQSIVSEVKKYLRTQSSFCRKIFSLVCVVQALFLLFVLCRHYFSCLCCAGTMVEVKKLFHSLPVRKQVHSNNKLKKEQLKKVEELLMAYSLALPSLHITLHNDKWVFFYVAHHFT